MEIKRILLLSLLGCILLLPSQAYGQDDNRFYTALMLQEEATLQDSLNRYSTEANRLWADRQGSLGLAADYLALVSRTQAEPYYKNAAIFYFWSLKNADFQADGEAIEREVRYLLPLVSDSTARQWQSYLNNNDPQLLDDIIGFWKVHDPYAATTVNERLLEHWNRIQYARRHFNRNNDTVYGTDERGLIYVRFGPPDHRIQKTIHLSGVIDPVSFQYLTFELGNIVRTEVEIWKYRRDGEDDWLYMFGNFDGSGEFGLRKDVLDLIDTVGLRVQIQGGNWLNAAKMRRFSERVAQYGLYEELAPYDPFFDRMFRDLQTSLLNNAYIGSVINRFLSSAFVADALVRNHFLQQSMQVPPAESKLKRPNERLITRTDIFRFRDEENRNEYLFSVQAQPGGEALAATPQFLSNRLYVYDQDWTLLDQVDELIPLDSASLSRASTYRIGESMRDEAIYYAAELIDTTRNGMALPGRINSETAAIVASSGKEKLWFPRPLGRTGRFTVSDVVIGKEQSADTEVRLPIRPALDYTFREGANLMIYFEAYHVPKGGYSYTYYFKKDRWLLANKRIEKSQVTILGDKVESRDSQLFTIPLDELAPGDYQLVLEFNLLGETATDPPLRRKIDFTIVE